MGELSLDKIIFESITVDKANSANKPWIVLINGLFAGLNSWDLHIPYLTPYFNVIRYNGPGQGSVESLDSVPTLSDQVQLLEEILDHLEIESAYLLGISNGARVALKFAEIYPRRVARVFSLDTYDKLGPELRMKLESWLDASRAGGNDLRFKVSTPWIFGESFLKNEVEKVEFFKELNRSKPSQIGERLIESALLDEAVDLTKIEVPVDFFVGEEDILTTRELHLEMATRCRQSSLGYLRGGHASVLEYPQNISRILEVL